MAFVYLDDNMPEHPKIDGLSDGAFRLQVAAICYCNRNLTDGILPAERIPRLVPRYKKAHVTELVNRLIWVELDQGRAYEVHDYLQWNASREQVEARRAKKAEAGRKGATNRWQQ